MTTPKFGVIATITTILAVASTWAAIDLQFQHASEVLLLKKELAELKESSKDMGAKWKIDLVERGFAEYDRKSGEWKMLTKSQVVTNDLAEQEASSASLLPDVNLAEPELPTKKKKK